jgi:ribosome assembly protein 3
LITTVSSDSDSEPEVTSPTAEVVEEQPKPEIQEVRTHLAIEDPDVELTSNSTQSTSRASKQTNDGEVSERFKRYYLQRATTEFEEDLDKVRGADDFKGDALSLLIAALQQGTEVFSKEDQRRVVMSGESGE